MAITKSKAATLAYRRFKLTDSDFSAGRDNDTSLSAGTVGEIATAEVGVDGQLSAYLAVQLGQPAGSSGGDNQGNEPYIEMGDASPGDVSSSADWAFAVRDKGEVGGGREGNITGFRTQRRQDNDDPRQRSSMLPQQPVAREGKILQFLARDETASVTVDISQTNLEVPSLGGQD